MTICVSSGSIKKYSLGGADDKDEQQPTQEYFDSPQKPIGKGKNLVTAQRHDDI